MRIDALGLNNVVDNAIRIDRVRKLDRLGRGKQSAEVASALRLREHGVDSRALRILPASLVVEHEERPIFAVKYFRDKYRPVQLGAELILAQRIFRRAGLIETTV